MTQKCKYDWVGRTERKRRKSKLYGVWLNSRKRHLMTFECFVLKLRGMKFTRDDLTVHRIHEYMENDK